MRRGLSFDHLFPIRDPASARLARAKADCLLDAGVIEPEDRTVVYGRSTALLEPAEQANPVWSVSARQPQAQA